MKQIHWTVKNAQRKTRTHQQLQSTNKTKKSETKAQE